MAKHIADPGTVSANQAGLSSIVEVVRVDVADAGGRRGDLGGPTSPCIADQSPRTSIGSTGWSQRHADG